MRLWKKKLDLFCSVLSCKTCDISPNTRDKFPTFFIKKMSLYSVSLVYSGPSPQLLDNSKDQADYSTNIFIYNEDCYIYK